MQITFTKEFTGNLNKGIEELNTEREQAKEFNEKLCRKLDVEL